MSITTQLNLIKDVSGYNAFGVKPSNTIGGVLLYPNVAKDILTVPSDEPNYMVVFSQTPGTDIFVDGTTTASVYSGTAALVTSEHNPTGRQYKAGTVLSVITPTAGGSYVSASAFVIDPKY